jgi:hypothetical protein
MAAQQPEGVKGTDLQQHDLSVPGHEVVQARVDIGPTAPFVKHTHPGEGIISGNAAELATYVVEKGKPILTLIE